jgi:hypothetical protein
MDLNVLAFAKEHRRRMEIAETRFFRAIAEYRMKHRYHKRNKDNREEIGITDIKQSQKHYQKWLEHLLLI